MTELISSIIPDGFHSLTADGGHEKSGTGSGVKQMGWGWGGLEKGDELRRVSWKR